MPRSLAFALVVQLGRVELCALRLGPSHLPSTALLSSPPSALAPGLCLVLRVLGVAGEFVRNQMSLI